MRHDAGMARLAGEYGGFIVDLWGVVHDGVAPLPGAADCLSRIKAGGGRVVLLSNAPRRAAIAAQAMRQMGLADHLYDGILTSGEVTHTMLRDRADPWFANLGRRVFHLGPERDRNVIEGLDYRRVEDPKDAEFVLNTGPDDHRNPTRLDEFEPTLELCAAQRLPMVCANPDREVIRGGVRVLCAGALAERYRELGGVVRKVGKPDPSVYAPALTMLGLPRPRVLAVGDALETDIAGAASADLPSCWVLGGIHGERLRGDRQAAEEMAKLAGLNPVATVPAFVW
ncbi:MAG TPA: TIGR01459 family HAD-type hydrolase [Acetobacteraceae bacterium]|nr:TIGR01459 family HAD-type hydrolase [Acetobacteraceae bacterium]